MPVRRCPTARAVAPLAWLLGCTFTAPGLGSATVDLATGSTTGETEPSPTSTGSTGEVGTTEDASSGPGSSDSGAVCTDDCPPQVGWTVVVDRVGHALVLAAGGDVVVAGDRRQADDELQRDVWVARYAGDDGQQLWEQRHAGAEGKGDFARAVVVLGDGRIVAGGASQEVPGQRQDVWVGWYAADGEALTRGELGTSKWDGDNLKLDESVRALALDEDGELIVGGTRCQSPCLVPDAWIGRFTREGLPQWGEPMLVCGPGSLRGVAPLAGGLLAVGTDGHVDAMAPWRTQIRSFDASGAGLWSALQEPPGEVGFDALGVAVGPGGELWVVGRELDAAATTIGGFVRLYRPERGFMPEHERRGATLDGEAAAVAVAADGSVVVTGTAGLGGARHLWLGSFSGELGPVWRIDEPAAEVSSGRAVALDGHGVVVLGHRDTGRVGAASTWLRRYLYQP